MKKIKFKPDQKSRQSEDNVYFLSSTDERLKSTETQLDKNAEKERQKRSV